MFHRYPTPLMRARSVVRTLRILAPLLRQALIWNLQHIVPPVATSIREAWTMPYKRSN